MCSIVRIIRTTFHIILSVLPYRGGLHSTLAIILDDDNRYLESNKEATKIQSHEKVPFIALRFTHFLIENQRCDASDVQAIFALSPALFTSVCSSFYFSADKHLLKPGRLILPILCYSRRLNRSSILIRSFLIYRTRSSSNIPRPYSHLPAP